MYYIVNHNLKLLFRNFQAVFVWFVKQRGRKLPKEIKKRFPSAIQLPVHYYQKLTKEKVKPVAIGVALLPPGKN